MAKGIAGPKAGQFNKYRLRESETIEVLISDNAFTINGTPYNAGDGLVKDATGTLTGISASDLEERYEFVKPFHSRKKKADGTEQVVDQEDVASMSQTVS